ncbi:MAG: valine--tRNA ligase [Saprospiraceae bacterium]
MSTENSKYNPDSIEKKWYQHWMEQDYFSSSPDDREPYTIVIPPPNVTGVLHMGHMLNNTIQDILIRKARLEGKNACWVPGTDHASIATEAKVVKLLREQGIKKSDLSRDKFLEHAFEWKDKYGGIILDQLKRLGASCDWKRTRFTMEDKLSKAVVKVFVDLYKKGKIYRGKRMINWDPSALTALSNEEVIYKEENSRLFYVRYKVEGTEDEWVTIATTRPETILGDSAVAVNPDDERYANLKGKRVIVPMANRSIPIIQDKYVDTEFGTGCLKVTPAHDMNDNEIGERHNLEIIDVFNDDGTMSEAAGFFIGEDRFAVRKKIAKELEASGHIVKIEDYRNKVGRSERTDAVVEPRLMLQWFLEMKDFSATALNAVESGEVTFHPKHMWNMYNNWLKEENVRDWCISRQLWWGQQIPAYYYGEEIFVGETKEEALAQAREKTGNPAIKAEELIQDEDVVDTWFSSWLWPISVFDGFENKEELKYYYPTDTLVTGWDIMFFWVARMVMAGYEYTEDLLGEDFAKKNGRQPFQDVYFTGMVRDKKRRKMSKSLGNSPDALSLIDNYGADGVRFGMLSSAAAGNDIIFDAPINPETKKVENSSQLCSQGQKFCNKMWQAHNLIKGWEVVAEPVDDSAALVNSLATAWFENKLQQTIIEVEKSFETFRLSEALMSLYNFIWGDFCSWYLEMVKPVYGQPIDKATYEQTLNFFERLTTLLHPFMPFVTEEIWHQLRDRKEGEDCVVSSYPTPAEFDAAFVKQVDTAMDVVSKARDTRNQNAIKGNERVPMYIEDTASAQALYAVKGLKEMVVKMAGLSDLIFTKEEIPNTVSFLSGTEKYFMESNKTVDVAAERERIEKEIDYFKGFKNIAEKKLSNERFVSGAPAVVVDKERQKLADANTKIKLLEEALAKL